MFFFVLSKVNLTTKFSGDVVLSVPTAGATWGSEASRGREGTGQKGDQLRSDANTDANTYANTYANTDANTNTKTNTNTNTDANKSTTTNSSNKKYSQAHQ